MSQFTSTLSAALRGRIVGRERADGIDRDRGGTRAHQGAGAGDGDRTNGAALPRHAVVGTGIGHEFQGQAIVFSLMIATTVVNSIRVKPFCMFKRIQTLLNLFKTET